MKKRCEPGFTLLEVIIAITILTLVTLIIAGGFRLGIQAWEKGESETGNTQRLRILSGMLSQQIKSVYPYKMKLEDEDEPVAIFKGEKDSVLFVTTFTDTSYGGFKWVKYTYKDGTLFYKEGRLPDKKIEENMDGDEEVIDSQIDDVKFEYLTSDDEWEESWDFGKQIPYAVRVKISFFEPFVINMPLGKEQEEPVDELLDEG